MAFLERARPTRTYSSGNGYIAVLHNLSYYADRLPTMADRYRPAVHRN